MLLFSIQRGFSGRESLAITSKAHSLGAEFRVETEPTPGSIPIGSVEYCEGLFGKHEIEFFPEFLQDHLHRQLQLREGAFTVRTPIFCKDATKWKSDHPTKVMQAGEKIPEGTWWISYPLTFTQEWRYYVAKGKVITTGWYAGDDEDEPAPKLAVNWPENFSGAVDFGRLEDGRLALVECHAPFACGWYGEDHTDYANWQIEAWNNRDWWTRTS